jgi:hypothetical protein
MSLRCQKGVKSTMCFHVSCLKKALGQHVTYLIDLPPLDEKGQLELVPREVLEARETKLRNKVI